MTCYSGIDLHSNNSVVLVSDAADRVVYQRRLPNDLPTILAALEPHRGELAGVVVESTYNWYWLVDGLQATGYQVHLANTTAMKRYEGIKHSGDETDAAYLAHLLRLGILPTGYICPPQERARCAILPASGCSWCARVTPRCWRWRTSWHATPEPGSARTS
jgi:transposase